MDDFESIAAVADGIGVRPDGGCEVRTEGVALGRARLRDAQGRPRPGWTSGRDHLTTALSRRLAG